METSGEEITERCTVIDEVTGDAGVVTWLSEDEAGVRFPGRDREERIEIADLSLAAEQL